MDSLAAVSRFAYQDAQDIYDHHFAIIRYCAMGFRTSEIAEITGMSPGAIGTIRNNPLCRARINELREKLAAQDERLRLRCETLVEIERAKQRAVQVLNGVMDAPNELSQNEINAMRLKLAAAGEALDRGNAFSTAKTADERPPAQHGQAAQGAQVVAICDSELLARMKANLGAACEAR